MALNDRPRWAKAGTKIRRKTSWGSPFRSTDYGVVKAVDDRGIRVTLFDAADEEIGGTYLRWSQRNDLWADRDFEVIRSRTSWERLIEDESV